MNRKAAFLIIYLFICGSAFCQSAFYDALFIKNSCYSKADKALKSRNSLLEVLAKYHPGINANNIDSTLKANPFFKPMVPDGGIQVNVAPNYVAGALSQLGGLDVTNFANALADILIDRAKQELTVTFFDKFKDFANSHQEFATLFPKTTSNLSNLLSYTYPQMLPALRTGFLDDIKLLAYNVSGLLELPKYKDLLKHFPAIRIAIRSLRIVHELETGASNIADVIKEFSSFEEWRDANASRFLRNAGSGFKIAAIISESLRNNSAISNSPDIWVTASELKNLFYDDDLFNIYFGLVYEQLSDVRNNIVFFNADGIQKSFKDAAQNIIGDLFLLKSKLKEFVDLSAKVNTAFVDVREKLQNKQKLDDSALYNYINVSIDVADNAFGLVKIFDENFDGDNYIQLAKNANNVFKSIYTKHYSQAISSVFNMFSTFNIISDSETAIIKTKILEAIRSPADTLRTLSTDIKGNVEAVINGRDLLVTHVQLKTTTAANEVQAAISSLHDERLVKLKTYFDLKEFNDVAEKIKPYALFITNIIEAKTEDDIKIALENAILPVGSSSVKKNTLCNLSIQAYMGARYSWLDKANSATGIWADKLGVFAPVGISYTPSFLSWKKGGALSLFVSLLDVGAIADYKLKQQASPTNPNATVVAKDYSVQLAQIFSPGFYTTYGFFSNIPLAAGFGAQYGPGLSKIDATGSAQVMNPAWRWNVFVAVDIPFFNLKNKIKH